MQAETESLEKNSEARKGRSRVASLNTSKGSQENNRRDEDVCGVL